MQLSEADSNTFPLEQGLQNVAPLSAVDSNVVLRYCLVWSLITFESFDTLLGFCQLVCNLLVW